MKVAPHLLIERMRSGDIPAIQAIEREIFLSPWPRNAYASELSQNRQAHYFVLRDSGRGEIVGYGGLWKVSDEAHITTLGVRTTRRESPPSSGTTASWFRKVTS